MGRTLLDRALFMHRQLPMLLLLLLQPGKPVLLSDRVMAPLRLPPRFVKRERTLRQSADLLVHSYCRRQRKPANHASCRRGSTSKEKEEEKEKKYE
jgi:hypothetical protein